MLDQAKGDWVEYHPHILWSYHTTLRTATRDTPYSLVYGLEVVIPTEIAVTSTRTTTYDDEVNQDKLRINLDLLEQRQNQAMI